MTVFAPGTQERDPTKQNMALQDHAKKIKDNTANVATNTASIASNTASIASNTSAITALQTAGSGLVNSGGSLAVSLPKITASLGANVSLNNTANYFDGPSVAQGSSGTWYASGSVTVTNSSATEIFAKLWDGTSVIASCSGPVYAAGARITLTLSGEISSPAGNLRISCRDPNTTTGAMEFNRTGNSKDCTITAVRIG